MEVVVKYIDVRLGWSSVTFYVLRTSNIIKEVHLR